MIQAIKLVYGESAIEEQAFVELTIKGSTRIVAAWSIVEYPTLSDLEKRFKDYEIELLYYENVSISA